MEETQDHPPRSALPAGKLVARVVARVVAREVARVIARMTMGTVSMLYSAKAGLV